LEKYLTKILSIENDGRMFAAALEIKQLAEQPADADLAQLVERNLAKVEVAGSNLVIRSIREMGYCTSVW
jgi:hypothetical protein